jgi:hypothetical protein
VGHDRIGGMADPLVCPDCGQRYKANAGHCRGGRFGGCCSSFATGSGFDEHRTGDHADGTRRCLTVEERREAGWAQRPGGFWASPRDEARAAALRAAGGVWQAGAPQHGRVTEVTAS